MKNNKRTHDHSLPCLFYLQCMAVYVITHIKVTCSGYHIVESSLILKYKCRGREFERPNVDALRPGLCEGRDSLRQGGLAEALQARLWNHRGWAMRCPEASSLCVTNHHLMQYTMYHVPVSKKLKGFSTPRMCFAKGETEAYGTRHCSA